MHKHATAARTFRPTDIAIAVAIATMAAAQAMAQTPAAAPPPASAASAAAAPAATGTKSAAGVAVIEITGTRASIQGSIQRKRNASTVSDSIVAEDIDQFPDKNVGEALSRISGVQLTREFGEGSQVSIRGVEPGLNRVEMNGMSMLASHGQANRGAELRELASELISSIDVVKGSTANLTEGGIGGTVSITTRKPLDFNKRTVAAMLSGERSSSRGGVQPRASLLLADRFLNNDLGLMANVVYDKVFTRNDYTRNTSWTFLRDWDMSAEKTVTSLNPAAAAVATAAGCSALTGSARTDCQRQWFDYAPRNPRYGIWERDHERVSAELTAQYRFNDKLDAWVSHQRNSQEQRLNDMNFGTDLVALTRLDAPGTAPTYNAGAVPSGGGCTGAPASATPAGSVVENHHVTRFTVGNCLYLAGRGGQGAFSTSARDFALDIESKYTSAGFKFKNDLWRVDGLLVDSKSDYIEQNNNIVLTQNAPGLVVSMQGGDRFPRFTFPAGHDPESAASYVQAQLQYRPIATFNTERQGKLDFQRALEWGPFDRLWFGGQARETTARRYTGGGYLASAGADLVSAADDVNVRGANVNQTVVYDPLYTGSAQRANDSQSFINGAFRTMYVDGPTMQQIVSALSTRSPGAFFSGYGIADVPASWFAPSYATAAGMSEYFDTSAFNFGNVYSAPGSDGNRYPQIPVFDVEERISAGYMRFDWSAQLGGIELDGNVGLRYTSTKVRSGGLAALRRRVASSPGSSNFTDRPISNTIAVVDNEYSDTLPSFNGTAHLLGGRLLARVGWAKVMSRPSLDQLAPNVTCTIDSGNPQFGGDGTDDCSGGNPALKPYRATKYDFSLEYYPSRDTQVSVALFRTDIGTYVRPSVRTPQVDFFGTGNLFDVTQPVNGEGARTQGLELAGRTAFTALPGWLGGFGVDANYTRMTFRYPAGNELLSPLDGSVLPYPGLSKTAYNLGLWYDRGMVNARLAWHSRDKYYTGLNDVSGNPNFRDKTGYLDAKLQLRLTDRLTVSFEGKNLTDQAELTYAGDLQRPNELAWSGRRYYVGLGYKL